MGRLFDFMLPPAKSPTADLTDSLFHFINEVSLIFLIGITVSIIYFVFKYRRKSDNDQTPVITHNNTLEITWSVIPTILVLIVFAWGYKGYLFLQTPPDDAYEIQVTGLKWDWTFKYSTGAVSASELHVPAGKPIKLVMKSEDVLHSFYVPDYRIKQDVLPNRYTTVWFQVDEAGESQIYCTEYCGTSHSNMLAKVIVHEPEDFQMWLNNAFIPGGDLPPAEQGEQLVKLNACLSCHSLDGSRIVGPSFKGIWGKEQKMDDGTTVTVDENYIRESILYPGNKVVEGYLNAMTPYLGRLNDDEIDAIIEYFKTLE